MESTDIQSLWARQDAISSVLQVLIRTHPDPAALQREWNHCIAQTVSGLAMHEASSGQIAPRREQARAHLAYWGEEIAAAHQDRKDNGKNCTDAS